MAEMEHPPTECLFALRNVGVNAGQRGKHQANRRAGEIEYFSSHAVDVWHFRSVTPQQPARSYIPIPAVRLLSEGPPSAIPLPSPLTPPPPPPPNSTLTPFAPLSNIRPPPPPTPYPLHPTQLPTFSHHPQDSHCISPARRPFLQPTESFLCHYKMNVFRHAQGKFPKGN